MGTKRKQLPGTERKTQLLDAGAKLAVKHGAANVTRRMVAKEAKVAEALVSHYLGTSADAQAAYAKHARKLGLTLPNKAETAAIGLKMRKHKPGDKRDTRRRSTREVRAIKETDISARVRGNTVSVSSRRSGVDLRSPAAQKMVKTKLAKAKGNAMETKPTGPASNKPAGPRETKPTAPPARPAPGPAETKTAARAPKAAPPNLR